MNSMQIAIAKKDIRGVLQNKRLAPALIVVPLVFALALPTMFILMIHFAPNELSDFETMINLLPISRQSLNLAQMVIDLIINNIMPIFFIIMPIMAASVMAASSFIGEKEKSTLETLLYCPLTLKQIFQAKIAASFFVSMLVTGVSFIVMILVVEIELHFTTGQLLIPSASWLVILLLITPSISLIAISLIVRGSAKAQSMEEAQQRSLFLLMPVFLLLISQFIGLSLISTQMFLVIGLVCALIAFLFLKDSMRRFTYEILLQ